MVLSDAANRIKSEDPPNLVLLSVLETLTVIDMDIENLPQLGGTVEKRNEELLVQVDQNYLVLPSQQIP